MPTLPKIFRPVTRNTLMSKCKAREQPLPWDAMVNYVIFVLSYNYFLFQSYAILKAIVPNNDSPQVRDVELQGEARISTSTPGTD